MSFFNKIVAAFVLLFLVASQLIAADEQTENATPEQLNAIKNTVLAHLNYFRAVSAAAPLAWNDTLTGISDAQAMNCSLQYDIFNDGDRGQIIFNLGKEDGSWPDIVNGTWLAIEYWWDERKMYHPKSEDYDNLQAFKESWEFSQMVWSSSKQIGCGWNYALCPYPADAPQIPGHTFKNTAQFVCNMVPAGNQWEKFGANVHCLMDGCNFIEPQTNTIDTATISLPTGAKRSAGPGPTPTPGLYHYTDDEIAALKAELDRVSAYKHMSPEEFIPDFIPNVQNTGKLMADAGHEGMVREGFDAKYFDDHLKAADLDAPLA